MPAMDLHPMLRSASEGEEESTASSSDDDSRGRRRPMFLALFAVIAIVILVCFFMLFGSGKPKEPDKSKVRLWETSQSGLNNRLTAQAQPPEFEADFAYDGPVVDIATQSAPSVHPIDGFGGAFTDASALVFKNLSAQAQKQVLDLYFGKDGLGFTMGRVHINSCDFSTHNYAFAEVDGDLELKHFDESLAEAVNSGLVPLIKQAQDVLKKQGQSLKLLATPWSPPAWMKTNGQMDHSGKPCLKDGVHQAWAKYFPKWISAMKSHGVNIWAITVQNEPENNATWEGCLMNATEESDFLGTYLGPIMKEKHPKVAIFVYDHNKDHVYNWTKAVYSHPEASKYVAGVAYHWYSGDNFQDLEKIQADYPQAKLLASEATWERWRWRKGTSLATGDWSFGEGYAHDIIGDLNAGSIGWIDWNLLLDENGGPNHVNNVCDSVMMANLTTGELFIHPQYYFVGHFSKFILPGSKLLESTVTKSSSYNGIYTYACKYVHPKVEDDGVNCRSYGVCSGIDGLQATSFERPDGLIASVLLNCGEMAIEFKLRFGGKAFRATLPPHSIQTYLFGRPE